MELAVEQDSITITRVYDIAQAIECIPMEQEIYAKGRETLKPRDTLEFIKGMLGSPLFEMYLAHDADGVLIGYVCFIINLVPGMKKLIMIRIHAKSAPVMKIFNDLATSIASEHKIKTVSITMTKHIRALQRRYKFVPVSVNMERSL